VCRDDRSALGWHRRLLQAGKQGLARLRRGSQQQDPRHPAPRLWSTRPGISAAQGAHMHASSPLKWPKKPHRLPENPKKFYPDEHSMLEYLAKNDVATFADLYHFNPAYVEHLIGYGLVVRRGDDYEFGFDAIAESVKANFVKPPTSGLDERWREISSRRNRLEGEIRTA